MSESIVQNKRIQKTTRPGGFFITGTDTEIGKTYVTCCLATSLKTHYPSLTVYPRKPIASGAREVDDHLISEDAEHLKLACDSKEALDTICPYILKPAISPQRALNQANLHITTQHLASASQTPDESHSVRLVEGAGGFYSPLATDGLNVDLAQAIQLPVVLVVGNRLGCLNHALLTARAIENAGLKLAAVVLNDIHPNADSDNWSDLQALLADTPCYHLPYSKDQAWQILDSAFLTKLEHFFPF